MKLAEDLYDDRGHLKILKQSGILRKVEKMIKKKKEVWIKRSSGEWNKGKAVTFLEEGLKVIVMWEAFSVKKGRVTSYKKVVETEDFYNWQDEVKNAPEAEVIDLATRTSARVNKTLSPPPLHESPAWLAKKRKEQQEQWEEVDGRKLEREMKEKVVKMVKRSKEASPKVRARFEENYLPRYEDGGYGARMHYITSNSDWYHLAKNPKHPSGGGHFDDWSSTEIKELEWVIYGDGDEE